jgi:hypothetical protein
VIQREQKKGYAGHMQEKRNADKILVGKPKKEDTTWES